MTALLLILALAALVALLPLYRTARAMEAEAGWWEARTAEIEAAFERERAKARTRPARRNPEREARAALKEAA
jgi:hypothetical protein